ncbi:MAG: MBL fold metallo-hydrolase [Candidatus Aureabacteria bacterium]|nr:MBL fold metallo-hydrolase [Candidatus Auribacterota bacterium]
MHNRKLVVSLIVVGAVFWCFLPALISEASAAFLSLSINKENFPPGDVLSLTINVEPVQAVFDGYIVFQPLTDTSIFYSLLAGGGVTEGIAAYAKNAGPIGGPLAVSTLVQIPPGTAAGFYRVYLGAAVAGKGAPQKNLIGLDSRQFYVTGPSRGPEPPPTPRAGPALTIYTFNVNWGDSTLFVFDDGENKRSMLVDAGGNGAPVRDRLNSLGISSLDYTVLTHGHDDHYGGFNEIVDGGHGLGTCFSYIDGAWNGVSFQRIGVWDNASYGGTDTFDLGSGVIARSVIANGYIVGGGHVGTSDENTVSVGILLTWNEFDFLVAGDLYATQEIPLSRALRSRGYTIDALNVNHHGSDTSTCLEYCLNLLPNIALIQVGPSSNSSWDFPNQGPIDNLNASGVEHIYVTSPYCDCRDNPPYRAPDMTYEWSDIVLRYDGGSTYTVSGATSGTLTYAVDGPPPPTSTPTKTPTRTPTRTPKPTRTPTSTRTPTCTRTPTPTRTSTCTPTSTPTRTPTVTPTTTPTPLSTQIFLDDFATNDIDPAKWVSLGNAESNTNGRNEPTSPYSLNLDGRPSGGDEIQSITMDLSTCAAATLSYFWERTGFGNPPAEGEDLWVDYWNGTSWVNLAQYLGSGAAMTTYQYVIIPLPTDALHNSFQLRFRSIGKADPDISYSDWFIDDVEIRADAIP